MAFTLWDDEFARVANEPMGRVILPQMLFYIPFLLLTVIFIAISTTKPWFRSLVFILLTTTMVFSLLFTGMYGQIQQIYPGGRQGPIGWTILEYPWISLGLFCSSGGLGITGTWMLFSTSLQGGRRDFPTMKDKIRILLKDRVAWLVNILIITGMVAGSLLLNMGLILLLNNANIALILNMTSISCCTGVLMFKRTVLKHRVKNRGAFLKVPNFRAFQVNPKLFVTRPIRDIMNGVLTAVCTGVVAAMCYMTVPDEWVFDRTFDLLPWLAAGCVVGIMIMFVFPEPALFFPATLVHVASTYDAFVNDFTIPFQQSFIFLNGFLFGFWIGVLMASQYFTYRAMNTGRNINLTFFLSLALTITWVIISFVDRFQNNYSQQAITDAVHALFPILIIAGWVVFFMAIGIWGIDVIYRILTKSRIPRPKKRFCRSPGGKRRDKATSAFQFFNRLPGKKRKIISIAIMAGFIGSMALVQGLAVHANQVKPLLVRTSNYGIWSVPSTEKVERSFPLSMPVTSPQQAFIDVSAAKGEWEGWHLLISPRKSKTVVLTNVTWTNFTHDNHVDFINASSIEVFLVEYLVDEQPDILLELPENVSTSKNGREHVDLFWRVLVPRNATEGKYSCNITLIVNDQPQTVATRLNVFNFTIPKDRHLKNAFGGGWTTEEWFDELEYLRISQYGMAIPFSNGQQYWWNGTAFEFNWTLYDSAFQAQLDRGFTSLRQGYMPVRPSGPNDTEWAQIEADFVSNVSDHLEHNTWVDEIGDNHSWIEIPYYYWTDEPPVDRYPEIKERNDRYHAGTSKLKTLLTEEFLEEYPILHDCVDIWCPVIGNFKPRAVTNRHAAGQEYWFYVCVGPTAPYPNFQLWEAGHNPRLIPYIGAGFGADGFLYWRMTAGNSTYRAGYDGNGDGQIAFTDPRTGRALPTLRLLSYSAGLEDFEYIWLMRTTLERQSNFGGLPATLVGRIGKMESRLTRIVGSKPQFVDHDYNTMINFRNDLADLLEDLWPYTAQLYP
ncbi:MAG: glycoside hydrolase domain-containing protein [Promethearchaeota archaeon]